MAQKKTGTNVGKAVAIGAGVAILSGAAYLLFGPEGKKHRKDLKSWMIKMKAEVMEKMEKAKDLSAETYEDIVHTVAAKYKTMKHVDGALLAQEVAALKKNWKSMTASKKPAKKVAKKAAKK